VPHAEAAEARVRTGMTTLDDRLGGGFPRPSTLLLISNVPAEKRVFAAQFMITGLRSGETCLYVDFFRAPQLARREFSKFGEYPTERLVFVDATSTQLLVPSVEPYAVRNIGDFDHIMDTIERALLETRPSRAIVDSMEFLTDRFEKDLVMNRWHRLIDVAKSTGTLLCFLFINWTYEDLEIPRILEMSDYVLEFRTTEDGGTLRSSLRIRATRNSGFKTAWIPYTFKDFVGVTISFPRILITGPPGAGKSTVLRALSRSGVTISRLGKAVTFDYGNVELLGLEAEILGTRGHARLESIFRTFAQEVNGVLLVVDATRPRQFGAASRVLDLLSHNVPYVVLANKSDLPGAVPPDAVRAAMGLPPTVLVFATVAKKGVMVQEALRALAETVVRGC